MPYGIGEKGTHGCSGFPVIKKSDGTVMGCHATKEKAKKQLAALYINEPSASKSEEKAMAVTDFATSYAAIIKQEKQEDGSLMVYGKATDDAIDIDNQICDAAWLNKAMPDWFKSGGNIREQHSNIAAGVAKELNSKSDGHYITAHVVDASSVKKVEAGVLKGFSIGIRAPRIVRDEKAANGRIIDGTIVEVSLVDRPANPNAKLMLAKSNGTEMVQVEEMIEELIEAIVETPVLEEVVLPDAEVIAETPETISEVLATYATDEVEVIAEEKSVTATYLVQVAKALTPDVVKFDNSIYETARGALASLIAMEATDLANGADEQNSLNCLMSAVNALLSWRAGEDYEAPMADADVEMATEPEVEKSTITPLPAIERVGDVADEDIFESNDSLKSDVSDEVINSIIEKAVKSATESVRNEIDLLKSANEAAQVEVNKLHTELETANQKAVSGGPKRGMIVNPANATLNEFARMANDYRAKSAATSDKLLAQGYKELAKEFEEKALQIKSN